MMLLSAICFLRIPPNSKQVITVKKEIHVVYGNTPRTMARKILIAIDPVKDLKRDALIALKPNLVVAKPCSSGATTHPELVAGVIEYLQELKFTRIVIMEGSWVGARTAKAFKVCGYEDLAKKYNVGLIDLQTDSAQEYSHDGFKIKVCDQVMKVDYLINLPVMKGHCQTGMTCALKNLKGCIPDSEKSRFHAIGLHKPIAYLNKILKQNLIIVDAIMGDLSFEEGGNPVEMNRMFAGFDPVLIDTYAAKLMGFELSEIPYIGIAEKIGAGSTDLQSARIVELNKEKSEIPERSGKTTRLANYVIEKDACSSCYANLMHSLALLDDRGDLERLKQKIHIGQGFVDLPVNGIGIGKCAGNCTYNLKGCPPEAEAILSFIGKFI
jgi:uncharacterized protein (DUF362 family)